VGKFMRLFQSRQSACAFGVPNPSKDKAKADGSVKAGMDYRTEQRPFNVADVAEHLAGKKSIVAIPLLEDGTCAWAALDIDEKCPMPPAGKYLYWFPSKSGGWHGFVFFERPQFAARVRFYMRELAEIVGHPGCEVFPKQVMAASGNGINLPFFGAKAFEFEPSLFEGTLPPPPPEEPRAQDFSDDEGYWTDDSLRAMLAFYAECVPGFESKKCRHGWSVPCPGYDEGWDDGARHSANMFPRISHESLVFLKNGWPKFRCVHSHCDGVKTFNMWRAHWDPLRLWTFEEWLESELEKRGDYVR
jgi:hypothetical protein